MVENYGGLSYQGSENNKNIYVEIKPDSLLVRRLQNNDEDEVFRKEAEGTLERAYRVRTLEMGKNKGQKVAEQIFDQISNVQLVKAYSEEKFEQQRMVLVFNDMQNDSPDIYVQCTLINDYNSVNGYASSFIDRIPNITIGTPMTFKTWKMTDKFSGKDRRGITIIQNNEKVQSAYYDYKKKERIGDKPSAIKGNKLGSDKVSWDFTPVAEFQLGKFKEFSRDLENYWNSGEVATKPEAVVVDEENLPF
jgi:hypothetical protein